jgi:hypothetical protein
VTKIDSNNPNAGMNTRNPTPAERLNASYNFESLNEPASANANAY